MTGGPPPGCPDVVSQTRTGTERPPPRSGYARRAGAPPPPRGDGPTCRSPSRQGGLTPGTTHRPRPTAAGSGPAPELARAEAEEAPTEAARPEFRHVSVLGRLAFRHVSVLGGAPGRPRRRLRRPRAGASPRRRAGGRTGGSTCAGGRSRAARSGGRTGRGGLRSRGSPGLRSLAARAAPNHGPSQRGGTAGGGILTTRAVPGMSVSRDADAPTPSAHWNNAHYLAAASGRAGALAERSGEGSEGGSAMRPC